MNTSLVTPEQVMAGFGRGFKGRRLKNMAQEIAGLVNHQTELLGRIAYLEGLIEANGGTEALNLSKYVTEAEKTKAKIRRELEALKEAGRKIEAEAQERASQITDAAMQSLKRERANIRKEAVRNELKPARNNVSKTHFSTVVQAEQEAERILAEARADAFRVANAAWKEAQTGHKMSAVDVAAGRLSLALDSIGDYSKKDKQVKLRKEHESFGRATRPYLETAIALVGTPEENGTRVAGNFTARLVPRYHEKTADPSQNVSIEVDGKILGWMNTRESDYYSRFLMLMDNLGVCGGR